MNPRDSAIDPAAPAPPAGEETRSLAPPASQGESTVGSRESPAPAGPRPELPGYEILEELGRGGMGVVYKARQVSLGRLVAIKVIRGAGEEYVQRFHREAQAVARLQHPNLVQIHDHGSHEGLAYMVLEYADAGTLSRFRRQQPLEPAEAASLVQVLAHAIHHAHQRGILHRDLKPGNILLCRRTDHRSGDASSVHSSTTLPLAIKETTARGGGQRLLDLVPKVADFGLARRLEVEGQGEEGERLTLSGMILGTPCYMAPEQARAQEAELGPATDVYALGAILYELLTGKPPFQAASTMDTLMQVVSADPVPPRRLNKHCPRDLEIICLTCLAKEPGQRYASAADLAEDLRRFEAGEPLQRRPGSRPRRLWLWVRRHRQLAAAGLIGAALAGLFAIVYFVWLRPPLDPDLGYATQKPAEKPLPADLEMVPAQSLAFVSLRLADLWDTPGFQTARKLPPEFNPLNALGMDLLGLDAGGPLLDPIELAPDRLERFTWVLLSEKGPAQTVLIVRAKTPMDLKEAVVRARGRGLQPLHYRGMDYLGGKEESGPALHLAPGGQALVLGSGRGLKEWISAREMAAEPTPILKEALRKAEQRREAVFYAQNLTAAGRKVMERWDRMVSLENLRQLTIPLAAGEDKKPAPEARPNFPPLTELKEMVEMMVLLDRVKEEAPSPGRTPLRLQATLRFSGGPQARKAREALHQLGAFVPWFLGNDDPFPWAAPVPVPLGKELAIALQAAKPGKREDELLLQADLPWEHSWANDLADVASESALRVQSQQRLRRIGLALHKHVDASGGKLPAAVHRHSPEGRPLLSWRVGILPHLGYDALYKEFNLDEPWDSPHNKTLIERMPEEFQAPGQEVMTPGLTYFQVFTGKDTPFRDKAPLRLVDIRDGSSNTILVVEGASPVPWTWPGDLPYDPKQPLPELGGIQKHGINILLGDGSANFLPRHTPEAKLRALITPAGGD